MGKNKLKRFEENKTFSYLFQPSAKEMYQNDFFLKGKWNTVFFQNDHPIILEVGCGKGEYTTGLAEKNPTQNYIGVDIKGPRLWRGCKTVQEKKLQNVAFIRNKVEFLSSFFAQDEISEIWITFPDPQPKKMKKRLTSARFLAVYSQIMKTGGSVHLKTDSDRMHEFTNQIIQLNNLDIIQLSNDIYADTDETELTQIQTFYEQSFLKEGKTITYVKFSLAGKNKFINPED